MTLQDALNACSRLWEIAGCMFRASPGKRARSVPRLMLTYCDFTTGPAGESLSFEERVQEIYTRYHELSVEVQALREALPSLSFAVSRTLHRLKKDKPLEKVN